MELLNRATCITIIQCCRHQISLRVMIADTVKINIIRVERVCTSIFYISFSFESKNKKNRVGLKNIGNVLPIISIKQKCQHSKFNRFVKSVGFERVTYVWNFIDKYPFAIIVNFNNHAFNIYIIYMCVYY